MDDRMYSKKLLTTLLLTLLIVLAACGGGGQDSESAGGEDEAEDLTNNDAEDTLVVGLDDDPPLLDPHLSTAQVESQIFKANYETLINVDENLDPIPGLAKDWDVSEDGLTYTFYLQEGVTFHDGADFNAEAVKYNFERILDEDLGSPNASDLRLIEEMSVEDEYTFVVELEETFAPFLSGLSHRAGQIVSPKAAEDEEIDLSNEPVGTGPFQFVDRTAQSHLEFERFDDYWGESPDYKYLEYHAFSNEDTRITNLVSGDLDIVNRIAHKDIEQLEENPEINMSEEDGIGFQGLMLNTDREPFDNQKVRQAMNYAVDRDAITEVVFHNGAEPAVSPFAPSSWANNPDLEVPDREVEKAQELLEESGVEDLSFTLTVSPSPAEQQLSEMLKSMLDDVGFEVEIEQVEFGAILDRMYEGDYDVARLGWSGRVDPDGNAYSWFHTDETYNFTGSSNEQLDELLVDARTTVDQNERQEMYRQAAEILWDEAPYIFLYHENDYKPMKDNVQGFNHVPDGLIRPADLTLE
ncbi:peptide/nickel transport system substrate-binding protein [Alkalibacillus filiformis]|uniref:Peptide/nickel transport system substrate-binding protein n=1 Tax=Alkalibacillus filiformis TaxID=200990 RepID=A0ABU0DSJ7_9BACI|nr:ABC transporter substrate-binding protein [Alkalibacillus filiformis]MDQ0351421.1 peptide/nickel transport system substrate-binding protein [Alkalibacillus filiformis]